MRTTIYDLAKTYELPRFAEPDFAFTVTYIRFDRNNMFAYYRQHLPGMYLRNYGLCGVILDDEMGEDRINHAEIVVVARPHEDEALAAIRNLRQAGRLVVLDTDDYPHTMGQLDESLARFWTKKALDNYEACVREVDLLTVSVPPLAERMKELGAGRVAVIDNMLDPTSRRWEVDPPEYDGKVRILWTAGFTHGGDAGVLREPVKAVLAKYPQAVFRSVGFLPRWIGELNPDQVEIAQTGDVTKYPKSIAGCEISLGPLAENKANLYRSSVKAWEATCAGNVFVASDYGPYRDELRHRKTGMLCATEQDWIDNISELVEDEELRERLWRAAALEVLTNRAVERKVQSYYWAYRRAVIQRFGMPTNGVPQRRLEVVRS